MELDENHKDYEIAFLLREEGDFKAFLAVLKQYEMNVVFEGPVRKIALAYEIGGMTSAFFGYVRFTGPAARIPELDHSLTLNQSVLRSLIIKLAPGKAVQPPPATPVPAVAQQPMVSTTPVTPVVQEANTQGLPLSNEDLERKIEEILK